MTRDDAIRIANEAELCQSIWIDQLNDETVESVIRFAKKIAAAEREAIYDIVMMAPFKCLMTEEEFNSEKGTSIKAMAFQITSQIRERGRA